VDCVDRRRSRQEPDWQVLPPRDHSSLSIGRTDRRTIQEKLHDPFEK
jgi:hypothetical protein